MCGIIAISTSIQRRFPIDHSLEAIKHRGPDDSGTFYSDNNDVQLGHVRLSILDLSPAGHQPMLDSTGRFVIVFNGEIYNCIDLKIKLELEFGRINWKSSTDTEVILEGFSRKGVEFLDRLNGVFALSIYDKKETLLYVLRDPFGVKPLFITSQKESVYLCSELKGLLVLDYLSRTLREESLKDQLAFMYIPEPFTLYNEFFKIEPGICFIYRYGLQVDSRPLFKHLHIKLSFTSENEAIESLRQSFDSAVKRQLLSDVPVSIMLSGGLDSSAVAYKAVKGDSKIDCAYTIAFSQKDLKIDQFSNDLFYAKMMAKNLDLNLCIVEAKPDFLRLIPSLIGFMEDGFTDPSAINTYIICQEARNSGVKVMLSGQGADEYLGGYRRYEAAWLLAKIPNLLRIALIHLGRLSTYLVPNNRIAFKRRLLRLIDLAKLSPTMRMLGMYTWTSPTLINKLLPNNSPWLGSYIFEELFDSYLDKEIIDIMMLVDHHYDLMSLNLCYTDRMSMAVGVEARVPFLDFELVKVMNTIPTSLKVYKGQGKYIFKKAMEPYLPKEVIHRDKAGFGLPLRAWLREEQDILNHYFDFKKIKQQGLFDSKIIENLLVSQNFGREDHTYSIYSLLNQQIWLEHSKL